jgi:hypothetical protein
LHCWMGSNESVRKLPTDTYHFARFERFRAGVAARNRVLALAFGHPSERASGSHFTGYGLLEGLLTNASSPWVRGRILATPE